jgi:periplasmic copper chaperone A
MGENDMKVQWLWGLVLVLLLVLLAGCNPPAASVIAVESAWGRLSPTTPTAGGMYMLIKNTGTAPDTLLSGKSPACSSIEVHKMVKKADGTMGMALVDKPLEIPAGGQVELKVGDLHIMCINMKADQFKVGANIDLTLVFEKAGEKTVSAEIRAQ